MRYIKTMKKSKIMEMCQKLVTPEIERNVEYSMFIADRIFDILDQKGMTQREFAKRLNKNESEISAWLTGTHTFTTKTLSKIEIALGERIHPLDKQAVNNVVKIETAPMILVVTKVGARLSAQEEYSFANAGSLVGKVSAGKELCS